MNRSTLIVGLNLLWATVAVAAFLLGRGSRSTSEASHSQAAGGAAVFVAATADNRPASRDSSTVPHKGTVPGYPRDFSAEGAGRTLESALADPDPIRRKLRVAELLTRLNKDNLPAILAAFESAPSNEDVDQHFREFLYSWGRLAGEDALAYGLDPDAKRKARTGSLTAMSGWAASDVPAAQDYVSKVAKKETREWLHYAVTYEMLRTDLDAAIAYSETNTLSSARGRQMDLIARALNEQRGIEGVQEWLEGIDHTNKKRDLLAYKRYATKITLDRMAAEDPGLASQWIEKHSGQPYLTSDGLERAARRAAGPINEELTWLANLPGVEGQRHAIGERFEDYIREDFEAAGEWLASQPLGPAFDEAIQDYARSAAKDDVEAAVAWAGRISDEELRNSTLRKLEKKIR